MAAVQNEISRLLLAAPSRYSNPPNAAVLLAASAPLFHVTAGGSHDPAAITFTATLIELGGTVQFNITGGVLTVAGNVATLTFENMSGSTAVVTAFITENGQTYTSNPASVTKVSDGADGSATTTYTWIKYGDSAAGAGITDDPTGKAYIGVAANKTTPTKSTNPADYVWSLIKGDAGTRGAGHFYADGSAWGDAAANAATPGNNVVDDVVTIFNGTGFAETRKWNGTNWLTLAQTVDATLISDLSLNAAKFAAGIQPITMVSAVPLTKSTDTIFNTANGRLYSWNGTAYVKTTPAADISGALTSDQIASLAAAKISGVLTSAQIADLAATKITGTLTNAQIADLSAAKLTGQITSTQITDNSISTPKLAAGAVVTEKIAAGAVTTEKLVVASVGSAINADPAFQDVTAWSGTIVSVTDGKVGVRAGRDSFGTGIFSNKFSPVDVTKVYRIRAQVRKSATANGVLYLGAQMLDSDGNNIPGNGSYFYTTNVDGSVIPTSFTEYVGYLNGPGIAIAANSRHMRPIALLNYRDSGTGHLGYMEIQDFRIEEVMPSTLIQDGAITTNKLIANAVTAEKILASAVTADKIAANSITAAKLVAATITANEIAANAITADKILASAVTAGKIAANAVTANTIAADSVTAGKIAASAISARELAANTILARHVVVANRDAVDPDPSFNDPLFWFPNSGGAWPSGITPQAHASYPAPKVLLFANVSGLSASSYSFNVERNSSYRFKVTVFKNSGTTGAFNISMHVPGVVYHPLGLPRTSTTMTWGNSIDFASIPADQWNTYTGVMTTGTIPTMNFQIEGGISGNLYFAIELVRASDASLIVDGAITADKIQANAITAAKILAGAVTADKITVSSLSSISANFGTVVINAGGSLSSGQTAYNTGVGFWLQGGATPKFSMVTANGASFLCDPVNNILKLTNATIDNPVMASFSITLNLGDISVTGANGPRFYGSRTATVTGGVAPLTYSWTYTPEETDGPVTLGGSSTATVSVNGDGSNGVNSGVCRLVVTDANGRTATKSFAVTAQHGTIA
jgi:hypothetical protein